MIGKELVNRAEILYNCKKVDIDNSYRYVSDRINKKTSELVDKLQSGLISKIVEEEDISNILQINRYFKEIALKTPEKTIIANDLWKTNNFLRIIQKYNK
jgi:hypothetical protein